MGSTCQAITALCCCKLVPGKLRRKAYLCACIMPSLGSAPPFHLIQWRTLIPQALSRDSRPQVALGFSGRERRGWRWGWGTGARGSLLLHSRLVYITIVLQSCGGLAPLAVRAGGSPGAQGSSLGGGSQRLPHPSPAPGTTGWMQQAASLSALPLFYHWGTCHRICAGAKPHISAAFIARLVLPCSSALLKTFVLGRAELHCYSPLSTNVSRITCMEMKCRHSYLVRWVWVSVLNLPSLLEYILWSSSLNIKNGNLKTISELVLLFQ